MATDLSADSDEKLSSPSSPLPTRDFSNQTQQTLINFPWQAWLFLAVLFLAFFSIGALYFQIIDRPANPDNQQLATIITLLWLGAGLGVAGLLFWMWREFVKFGNDLTFWAEQLREGNLDTRMPIRKQRCLSIKTREQINAITADYQSAATAQQQRLSRQAMFIAQKKHHLQVLYNVASAINRSDNLDDLLQRFLVTLRDLVSARFVAIQLLDGAGKMHQAAAVGEPLTADDKAVRMLTIPLQYRDKNLGTYNLYVPHEQATDLDDDYELLTSIGQHLGMAIEKANVDEEAHTLSIMEERTRMAHELHDSLAQTLASLRFKIRLFDDSLNQGDETAIWQELEGLEQTIDDAYAELRSLITDFRAPIDGKGVVRAVKNLSERLRKETDLEVFFYHNWSLKSLAAEAELEVVRIIQEALNNVRKHSQASTIRILMYSSEEGRCSILVEDDGIGLPDKLPEPDPLTGEHIGIGIMHERTAKLGGELQYESDPDEGGTLLQLSFNAPPTHQATVRTPVPTN